MVLMTVLRKLNNTQTGDKNMLNQIKVALKKLFGFVDANKGVTDAVIGQITRRVNGGTHGLDDRIKKTKQFAAWG